MMKLLEKKGIELKYHAAISNLVGGEPDYLSDLQAKDIEGCADASGEAIPAPVARGLLRKLQRTEPEESAQPPAAEADVDAAKAPAAESCEGRLQVTLSRGVGAGAPSLLVRCAMRGRLPHGGEQRRKVLLLLLDRSGSMAGAMWRRVVDAVASVATDQVLTSTQIALGLVVYSDQAREVRLPGSSAELREMLLSREYSPQGGTSFSAAFRLAQQVIERLLEQHLARGAVPGDVDIGALMFTDGEDTSVKGARGQYGVRLVDKEASSAAARAAGDTFRQALQSTTCSTYVCIAAFGADHDPDQCQYLSDRYYYINRGEALADALVGGIGSMINSAGSCSLALRLPKGVSLCEALPTTLPLEAQGYLDHHVWLTVDEGAKATVEVEVSAAGETALQGAASTCGLKTAAAGSFEAHLFLLDFVAFQLRQVARELAGRRPAGEELAGLRARLTSARDRLQPTKRICNEATGQLRGRAALRERLTEVEELRARLSYALGHFDEHDQDRRQIGSVAIDAILRDAGQHVPQGPTSAALARCADALAALPAPETLSVYGREQTSDAYSCCDAHELASQGDALFFQLCRVSARSATAVASAQGGHGFISYQAFVLLSQNGTKPITSTAGEDFTCIGLPMYITPGHFLRARMLLPDALRRLAPDGSYSAGMSERLLLSLLGRELSVAGLQTESHLTALLHKARGISAVLSSTPSPAGEGTLLDDVIIEAARFVDEPAARADAEDLHSVAATGLLAPEWPEERLGALARAVLAESLRRTVEQALDETDEARRLWLTWALLGGGEATSDAWLDTPVPLKEPDELRLHGGGFDPFTAGKELVALEGRAAVPRAAGAQALLVMVSTTSPAGVPSPSSWVGLSNLLPAWGKAVQKEGGLPSVWQQLDLLMTVQDTASHEAAVQRLVTGLRLPMSPAGLRSAFPDASMVASVALSACLPDSVGCDARKAAATKLLDIVERRAAFARRYPITGARFPELPQHTGEVVRDGWGAPAHPVDNTLHHRAKLRVFRRHPRISVTRKEALADKEYRRRGGKFAFPSKLDTFIRGLHRRTQELHDDWVSEGKATDGKEGRAAAVEEMLLRLRWDDNDNVARRKLTKMVERIWDDLEGVDVSDAAPLSSALWLDDLEEKEEEEARAVEEVAAAPELSCKNTVKAASKPDSRTETAPPSESSDAAEPELPPTGDVWEEVPDTLEASWDVAPASGAPAEVAPDEEAPAEEAPRSRRAQWGPPVMDEGLQSSFDALPADVRRRLEAFCKAARPGSRLNLPRRLRPITRKALHVWATLNAPAVEHKSFGFAAQRRLRFWVWAEGHAARDADSVRARDLPRAAASSAAAVAVPAAGVPAAAEEDDFDCAAWMSGGEEGGSQYEEEGEEW